MADSMRDADVDALYQLPLAQFTPARNALAKAHGKAGAAIRSLVKPHAAAWGVNLLFWQDRPRYDALIAAAVEMRHAHARLLSGESANVSNAEARHQEAIRDATGAIERAMRAAAAPPSASTLEAIRETLQALPQDDPEQPAGRLTHPLKPLGFGALMALGVSPGPRTGSRPETATPPNPASASAAAAEARRAKAALARQKKALAAALRAAEGKERRAEEALAAAQRDQQKVERDYAATRDRLQFLEKQRDDMEEDVRRHARTVQDTANARTRAAQDLEALVRTT